MFTVSDNAAAVVRELISNTEAPDGTGLRIASDGEAGSLNLALRPGPEPGDTVLDADGAQIFVDAAAAHALDGHAIDAVTDGSGRVQFTLAP